MVCEVSVSPLTDRAAPSPVRKPSQLLTHSQVVHLGASLTNLPLHFSILKRTYQQARAVPEKGSKASSEDYSR